MIDSSPATESVVSEKVQPRIEGNYLQSAVQFWVGINNNIWQQLSTTIAVQTAGIVVGYHLRGSLASWVVLFMSMVATTALFFMIKGNIEVRNVLTKQVEHISSTLLENFLDQYPPNAATKRPFVLYSFSTDQAYPLIRAISGTLFIWLGLMTVDLAIGVSINWRGLSDILAQFLPWLPPVFPPKMSCQ